MPEQGRMASRNLSRSASGVLGCARCDELSERVAWLEGELGIARDNDAFGRVRSLMRGLRKSNYGTATNLILALYAARGRVVSKLALMEAIPPVAGGEDDRTPKIIDVWVCVARKALGSDAIETAWGRGYRMTDAGRAKVAAILGGAA